MFSKSKSLISIAALVVSGFVVSTPASASGDCVVDTFDDVSGSNSKTLAACVSEVSDGETITFDTTTAQTITLDSTLTLDKADVTIEGPEFSGEEPLVTITQDETQGSGFRLLGIDIPEVEANRITTIKNLKFLNGENPDTKGETSGRGAAINSRYVDLGGNVRTSDLTILNSHFVGNYADGQGGAINAGDITITDSHFESNEGGSGGAVFGVNVTVTRSTFLENQSDGEGGALYTFGGDSEIFESTFENNQSDGEGGALLADGDSEIFESTFKNNKSLEDHGGAIDTEKISITDSNFIDNVANSDKDGGDSFRGGAVRADQVVSISGSTFDGNKVEGDDSEDSWGGALYVREMSSNAGSELEITNSTFVRNQAGSSATENGKGGAIFFDEYVEGKIVISNSRFGDLDDDTKGNKAYGSSGGAIEVDSSSASMTVTESTFAFNQSNGDGGALKVKNDVTISDSSFVGNTSEKNGGAIEADERLDVSKSFFSENEAGKDGDADRDGGAIWAESAFVENSTFYSNTAPQYGGAIYLEKDEANHSVFNTFVDNSAEDEASSIYAEDATETDPVYLFGNLFLSSSSSDSQLFAEITAGMKDLGANVSTSADSSFLGDETSEVSVDYASLGVGTPATATLSLRPFVPIDSISTLEVEVTEDLATNYATVYATVTSETLPTVDQQGTTRTYSFYPGAEFIAFGVSSTPAPYSGPLVTSIDSNSAAANVSASDTVTVSGQRLSTVSKVVVGGLEGEVISTSEDSFEMVVPEGLAPGNYDLEIQSSIGNLTYLGAFVVSSSSIGSQAFGEVTAWTTRVSDTQVKVYVKYPTVGEKLRIGHQSGGSGSYESVYVKTTASEDDPSMIVNEHGSYIVRTIDLENINRIRVTVGDQRLVQVRYNN